jgi:tetratricopeptide (TPR) repeat protein
VRSRFVAVAVLVTSVCTACPARIKPTEISREDRLAARRLMLEGDVLIKEGKDHLSLLKYLESSTLDPYSHKCFNKLAVAYARVLMFSQARRAIDRAIRLDREYPHAYNTRGIIQMALGKPGAAVGSFRKAVLLSPENPVFHLNLGRAHLEAGHYQESRVAISRALQLDPEVLELEDTIEVSAARKRDDPESYYRMARVFGEVGDEKTCLYYLRKALSSGFRDRDRLVQDQAFETVRDSRAFIELVSSYGLQEETT